MAKQPIEIFMPPNMLKAKVGSVAGGIDTAAIKRAEAAIEALKGEFQDWLAEDIGHLAAARDGWTAAPTNETRGDLFRTAHDLKGQAETLGCPLVARLAASLSKLIDEAVADRPLSPTLVDAHVAAIQTAFRNKIDANDPVAAVLANELEARVTEELKA